MLALPGGFVDYGEKIEVAARREAFEELNLEIIPHIETGSYHQLLSWLERW